MSSSISGWGMCPLFLSGLLHLICLPTFGVWWALSWEYSTFIVLLSFHTVLRPWPQWSNSCSQTHWNTCTTSTLNTWVPSTPHTCSLGSLASQRHDASWTFSLQCWSAILQKSTPHWPILVLLVEAAGSAVKWQRAELAVRCSTAIVPVLCRYTAHPGLDHTRPAGMCGVT